MSIKKIAFFYNKSKKSETDLNLKNLDYHLTYVNLYFKIFLFLKIEGRDLFIVSLKHCKYIPQPQK